MGEIMTDRTDLQNHAIIRELGALAKRRREEIGVGRDVLANEAGIESEQIVQDFEYGRTLPPADVQQKLEKALDWRLGIIGDIARRTEHEAGTLTMEQVDAEDSLHLAGKSAGPSLASASDDELLAEVARRGL